VKKDKVYPLYLAFGALILYGTLYLAPGLMGIGYTFTDWSSYSKELHFVGFENIRKILSSDSEYLKYIVNTLRFTFFTVFLKTAFGLLFATMLVQDMRGRDVYRATLFMPAVLSLLVTGLVFKSILNPSTGLLNGSLRAGGLDFLARKWLVDPSIAFSSIIAVDVWRGTGYIMCIIIAGLQSISHDYYEAAIIDGANAWQTFRFVTMPMLMPALTVTTVLNMIYGLKVFDVVYVLTNGGPGRVTEVLYTSVFREFSQGKYALSTAMASLMFVVMIVVGYFVIRVMNREETAT
jgi:raffinose/stachyose/melibiose transport system permease protein